jgi:hypothetical protein
MSGLITKIIVGYTYISTNSNQSIMQRFVSACIDRQNLNEAVMLSVIGDY